MREKVIATLCTVITLLGTIAPVVAYDLGDYPGFLFDDDQNLQAYVVVGAAANPADVVGAVDLAVRVAGESYEEVSATGVGVTGGKTEEVKPNSLLNASTVFGATLDDNDLSGLQDTSVTFTTTHGSENYDVHDELKFIAGPAHVSLETGLTADSPDEDFTDNIFLEVAGAGVIGYYYVLDDDLKTGKDFGNLSTSYPLEIEFLGEELKIVGASTNSLTIRVGEEVAIAAGESATVGGQTFTLSSCTETKAVVECGGSKKAIGEGAQAVLCGMQVYVDTIINDEGTEYDEAILIIGEDATKTYTTGDEYIGEDEDDPNWVWHLSGLLGTDADNIVLGVKYDQTLDEYDEVINLGEDALCLPNDYICIDANSLVKEGYQQYTVDTGREDLYPAGGGTTAEHTSAYIINWHAAGGGDDGFLLGTEKSDDIAVYTNATNSLFLYYKDPDDNKYRYAAQVAPNVSANDPGLDITYGDSTVSILFDWYLDANINEGNMTIDATSGDDIKINMEAANDRFEYLGETDTDTDYAYDLMYGTRDISGWDEDLRTETGIIIYDPKGHLSGDSFEFDIPEDESDFTVNVIITGPGGAVTPGEGIKKVVPITNAVAKLDTEISVPVSKHLVLVGGTAVNRRTADAMGYTYPTYGADLTEFGAGEGYIKVFEDVLEEGYVAVVVAGWEATDTRNACSVLQQYETFADELDGNVAVKVTSVTAAGITSAE